MESEFGNPRGLEIFLTNRDVLRTQHKIREPVIFLLTPLGVSGVLCDVCSFGTEQMRELAEGVGHIVECLANFEFAERSRKVDDILRHTGAMLPVTTGNFLGDLNRRLLQAYRAERLALPWNFSLHAQRDVAQGLPDRN